VDESTLSDQYMALLGRGAHELFEDNRHRMTRGDLLPTRHTMPIDDLRLFFLGVRRGTVTLDRGARFNTLDRPIAGGRWGLLSCESNGCRYNAEYLAQVAAYVAAVHELGYPGDRVRFELPSSALKLDLAILDDDGAIVIMGEAKRSVSMLDRIFTEVQERYRAMNPGEQGRNEAHQLAWRLWRTGARYLWFIGPGERRAYRVSYAPLAFESLPSLPRAEEIGLAHVPTLRPALPNLRAAGNNSAPHPAAPLEATRLTVRPGSRPASSPPPADPPR
jgi:hypothetical protein